VSHAPSPLSIYSQCNRVAVAVAAKAGIRFLFFSAITHRVVLENNVWS